MEERKMKEFLDLNGISVVTVSPAGNVRIYSTTAGCRGIPIYYGSTYMNKLSGTISDFFIEDHGVNPDDFSKFVEETSCFVTHDELEVIIVRKDYLTIEEATPGHWYAAYVENERPTMISYHNYRCEW